VRLGILGAAAVATAAMVTGLSSPSSASSPAPETTQIVVSATAGGAGIAVTQLTCKVTMDIPHYSSGAPGVIAKVRYSCFGNSSGILGVNANLFMFAPGTVGPYVPRASNSENRPVGPGSTGTVYVPSVSLPGIACSVSQRYFADAFISLSAGPSSGTGYVKSNSGPPPYCP
jgi:hypothetical protein